MSDVPYKSLARLFDHSRGPFSRDFTDTLEDSTDYRVRTTCRYTGYSERAAEIETLGSIYYKSAIFCVVFDNFQGQTAGWLTKLSKVLLSRRTRKTIVMYSGVPGAQIGDFSSAFYRLHGEDGATERRIVRNIFGSCWGWALTEVKKKHQARLAVPRRAYGSSMASRKLTTGIDPTQKIRITYLDGAVYFSMGVVSSQFLSPRTLKGFPVRPGLFTMMQNSFVTFVHSPDFSWCAPPYRGPSTVELTIEDFEANAYYGDGAFGRCSLDLIDKKYHSSPRSFKIVAHQVLNSNATFNALMKKNRCLANGGRGLTVHDSGSCFEITFALSVLSNRKDPRVIAAWMSQTFTPALENLWNSFKAFRRPGASMTASRFYH